MSPFFSSLLEHKSWELARVGYAPIGVKVGMIEPTVGGVPVTRYADLTTRQVLAFVEEVTAYALAFSLPRPIVLSEEPLADRDPINAQRFRLNLPGQSLVEWQISYADEGFR